MSTVSLCMLAGCLFPSCGDDIGGQATVKAVFTAAWDGNGTKASGGQSVNSLDILVFDSGGNLAASGRNPAGASVCMDIPKGLSATCYAVANARADLAATVTENGFLQTLSFLKDTDADGYEMTGGTKHTFIGADNVGISLDRIAAKVVLDGIALSLEDPAWAACGVSSIRITDLFLTNVVPWCTYGPSPVAPEAAWYNRMMPEPGDARHIIHESLDLTIPDGGCSQAVHTFHAYPNPTVEDREGAPWSARHTRLVVQAELDGSVCYYPVTLPPLERNHCYTIHALKITGAGSDSPDVLSKRTPVTFSVSVSPWTEDERHADFI